MDAGWETFFESVPDAMVLIDEDGVIREINSSAEEMFGYGTDELVGEKVERLVPESQREEHVGLRDEYIEEPQTRPMGTGLSIFGVTKHGDEIPIDIALSPVETDDDFRVMAAIRDRSRIKRLEDEVRKNERSLRSLHAYASDFDLSLDDKIHEVLRIGSERLGMSEAYLTSVEIEGRTVGKSSSDGDHDALLCEGLRDGVEVVAHEGDSDEIYEGRRLPLSGTYCKRLLETDDDFLGVEDIPEEWGEDSMAYSKLGLRSYIGTEVKVRDRLYGTLCFGDPEPGDEINDSERSFVRLLSRWLGYEIERNEREKQIKIFDRVLRHNLRNKMNVILGYADVIEQKAPEEVEDEVHEIIRTGESILSTSEKARELSETILGEESATQTVDVSGTVESAVEETDERYDAEIKTEIQPDVTAVADPDIDKAVSEVIQNAVVHNDGDPEVEVRVDTYGETAEIEISDNGEGIPDDEVEVLTGEREIQSLYHGSGLGLWLVHWIVRKSRGEIEFNTDDGTTIRMRLEAKSET
ncbi:PAS domain S-box protein [Halorutilales archaeon Cl-col2-1]